MKTTFLEKTTDWVLSSPRRVQTLALLSIIAYISLCWVLGHFGSMIIASTPLGWEPSNNLILEIIAQVALGFVILVGFLAIVLCFVCGYIDIMQRKNDQ